jgi:spoIIIJ-associated protein
MDKVERSAKTVELAIADALTALNATKEEVEITVINEGAKGGLFGIGSRPAVVKVSRKEDPETMVRNFLREVTVSMGLGMYIEITKKDTRLYVNFIGESMGILIGKRGQTIDSLQYLVNLMISGRGIKDLNVILDTGNYRKRRRDTLESLARNIARKIKEKRHSVKLEPMSRFERHIIHTTLQNNKDVRTYSEGNEPHRYVVIAASNKKS